MKFRHRMRGVYWLEASASTTQDHGEYDAHPDIIEPAIVDNAIAKAMLATKTCGGINQSSTAD